SDDGSVGLTRSLVSGFALDRLAEEEEEKVTFSEDNKSETSDTSSSSGSSTVGAYAMYSLSAREEEGAGSDPSITLDCCEGVEGIVGAPLAKPRDVCSSSRSFSSTLLPEQGNEESQRLLLSGNYHLEQTQSKIVIPEDKGLTAAVAS
ncbi:unnamed protein product, partial [Laminaria digitata]